MHHQNRFLDHAAGDLSKAPLYHTNITAHAPHKQDDTDNVRLTHIQTRYRTINLRTQAIRCQMKRFTNDLAPIKCVSAFVASAIFYDLTFRKCSAEKILGHRVMTVLD